MKLIDIPVLYICPDHNPKYRARKKHMEALLYRIGFSQVTHYKSSTESYPSCLFQATIDILSDHLNDSPILVLEDDVEQYMPLDVNTELLIPYDADAFYLGFSKSGGHLSENRCDGKANILVKESYIQIYNMLSAHAIVYISKRYKERVINELQQKQDTGKVLHSDVILSRLHPEFNIYGYRHPFFYQSRKLGNTQHVEDATKFHFLKNGLATTQSQCSIS
jgi:hypothetical protein